jgi:hypothetical protein
MMIIDTLMDGFIGSRSQSPLRDGERETMHQERRRTSRIS